MNSNTAFPALKRTTYYEEVLGHVKQYIVTNNLEPGDQLPTTAVLAKSLNVSRLTVREALKVLESLGVVETRTRSGTRLCKFSLKPTTDHMRFLLDAHNVPMQEVAAARQVLECSIMSLIVANADEDNYREIDEANVQYELAIAAGRLELITEGDRRFHCALLAATKNRALDGFGVMLQEFFDYLRKSVVEGSQDQATLRQKSLDQHQAIYRALRAGDAQEASSIMRRHLGRYAVVPLPPATNS